MVATLSEHWEAIDADFARFYGLRLDECCWGPRSEGVRRLRSLIAALPPEGAYRAVTEQDWTVERELAAAQVELTHSLIVLVSRLGGSKRKVRPLRVPRPGAKARPAAPRQSFLSLVGVSDDGEAG